IALAEDARGWAALCRAITALHWDPDLALTAQLAVDRTGLTVLSSDIDFLERVVKISGPAGICAELVPGPERHQVLATARRLGIPAVVTGAVAMADPADWQRQRLVEAIHRNGVLDSPPPSVARGGRAPSRRTTDPSPPNGRGVLALGVPAALATLGGGESRTAWLKPAAELERHFPDVPDAFAAAAVIAERCQFRLPTGGTIAPRATDVSDAMQRLRALAYEGALRQYGTIAPVTRDRLEDELGIIDI